MGFRVTIGKLYARIWDGGKSIKQKKGLGKVQTVDQVRYKRRKEE